jgi:hypothetical protein
MTNRGTEKYCIAGLLRQRFNADIEGPEGDMTTGRLAIFGQSCKASATMVRQS